MSSTKEITQTEKKNLDIAQKLVAVDGGNRFFIMDEKENFIINKFSTVDGQPYDYIARIGKHWYNVKKYKEYFGFDFEQKALVKKRITENWEDVPANENYSNIVDFKTENDQVFNKVLSVELDDSIQDEAIKILLNDFLSTNEGLNDYLIKVSELISGKDLSKTTIQLNESNGEVIILDTVFGKVYEYHENDKLIYRTLEHDNKLVVLFDALSVVDGYSTKDGLPQFNNAEDEAKYLDYCRGKDILFHYYYDNK